MKGKLIIIEGLDGSGKSTQMQLLCQRAEQLGKPVRRVKFPNYDEDSSALVKAYLSGELGSLQQINAYAASVLYSVDRYATWRRHMHSDYEQGAVFCWTAIPPQICTIRPPSCRMRSGTAFWTGWWIWSFKRWVCPLPIWCSIWICARRRLAV